MPLVEFAYNNSYHIIISMAPYEDLGLELVRKTIEQVKIRNKILTAYSRQKSYADKRRK